MEIKVNTFCWFYPLKTGCKIIAWLNVVVSVILMVGSGEFVYEIYNLPEQVKIEDLALFYYYILQFLVTVLFFISIIKGIFCILLLWGVYRSNPTLLSMWVTAAMPVTFIWLTITLSMMYAKFHAYQVGMFIFNCIYIYIVLVVYSHCKQFENVQRELSTNYAA